MGPKFIGAPHTKPLHEVPPDLSGYVNVQENSTDGVFFLQLWKHVLQFFFCIVFYLKISSIGPIP